MRWPAAMGDRHGSRLGGFLCLANVKIDFTAGKTCHGHRKPLCNPKSAMRRSHLPCGIPIWQNFIMRRSLLFTTSFATRRRGYRRPTSFARWSTALISCRWCGTGDRTTRRSDAILTFASGKRKTEFLNERRLSQDRARRFPWSPSATISFSFSFFPLFHCFSPGES